MHADGQGLDSSVAHGSQTRGENQAETRGRKEKGQRGKSKSPGPGGRRGASVGLWRFYFSRWKESGNSKRTPLTGTRRTTWSACLSRSNQTAPATDDLTV